MKHKLNEVGSHLVIIILFVAVLAGVGAVGWRVLSQSETKDSATTTTDLPAARQQAATNQASCDTTPEIALPVSKDTVESILYPGQVRGGNYKPHGGFRLNSSDNRATVTLPVEATLIAGARYIEQGEVQYMFDFETACNIRFRFDHLLTLSDALREQADKLPQPKQDDSRTTNLTGVQFSAGTVLATEVGFRLTGNVGFDFGMYDYNQKNKISQDQTWLADPQHQFDMAQHAVCWFDYLSDEDGAFVRGLPAGDQQNGKQSDYCS